MSLGERLKSRRRELGLTQKALGKKVGVSEATINRYENNVIATPSYDVLDKLVSALDINPNYLMGYEQATSVPPTGNKKYLLDKIDHMTDAQIAKLNRIADVLKMEDENNL